MVKAATGTLDRLRLEFASRSTLTWTLRIGACMCFVGHGAFGIMTKHAWLPYFAVANIGPDVAYRLMPVVGTIDVIVGTLALVCPIPAMGAWMTIWAIWTALLRPLSGESGWEALERAGNYGVPLALLLMLEPWHHVAGFVRPAVTRQLDAQVLRRVRIVLTTAVVLLLVGHGMLGLIGKPGHIANYASVLPVNAAGDVTRFAGALEILLAAMVIVRPSVSLFVFVAAWKLATESLFLTAGAPIWEIVERGGSYAAPIALAMVTTLEARIALRRNTTDVSRSAELPLDRPPQLDAPVHSSPA